jgi:hypothetical protein
MPVSGLVITLREGAPLRQQTVATVATHRSFTLGVLCDRWLPVAMEARDDRECRDLHDWLMSLPGVLFVDVVAVDFAPDDSTPSTGSTELAGCVSHRALSKRWPHRMCLQRNDFPVPTQLF